MKEDIERNSGSFKDPSGFVYTKNNVLYRHIYQAGKNDYLQLMESGLYHELCMKKELVSHHEVKENLAGLDDWFITIAPEPIETITRPSEWCFEQLKDAASLTLGIMKTAINYGMILKDATPYNIQFHSGRPVFIDTTSFERYNTSEPWVAYRQFCETFFFPLLLEKYTRLPCHRTLTAYPQGISVNIVSSLLPLSARLNIGVWMHVWLQNRFGTKKEKKPHHTTQAFSKNKMMNLIQFMEGNIESLKRRTHSNWEDYYNNTILSQQYLENKKVIIKNFIGKIQGNLLLDLGANDGMFSIMAAEKFGAVYAIDSDETCINNLYIKIKREKIDSVLPLVNDITMQCVEHGLFRKDQESLANRINPDAVLALALIHHIVISNNVPLEIFATFLYEVSPQLIIEFVPKEDTKVQFLLRNRKDVYCDYSREKFESTFGKYFEIIDSIGVADTARIIYLMKRK